jgi:hypothetical protein
MCTSGVEQLSKAKDKPVRIVVKPDGKRRVRLLGQPDFR